MLEELGYWARARAIQDIIDNIEIEFKITKEGHRLADIKLKK